MLISELKKYIQAVLLHEAYNPSASKVPLDLINDIFYNIHDHVLPTIFDFILTRNLTLDEFYINHVQYSIELQQLIATAQQRLLPLYNILIEEENWNFLNQVLIKNNVLKNDAVKLEIGYYHQLGCIWDINSELSTITAEDLSALGFCNFSKYDPTHQTIELFIGLNLNGFLIPYFLDLYENDRQKYFDMITQRNSINNELRITIRHEIEHYYQSINKLLYRVKKEYELRLKDNSLSNVAADCHNMIEHYILSDENIKGFGIASINTNYLRSKKSPFKLKSDFYHSRINRSYLYDELEISNHINDFCLLYVSYARHVFASADDSLLWLRGFLRYLKGCPAEAVHLQMWDYLNSGLWYTKNILPHPDVLNFFEDKRINVWDEDFKQYIGHFINNVCRASKVLLFLHEIFSNTNDIQQALRKELVNVDKYMQEFKKVRAYIIEKIMSKVHKLWYDQDVNPLEN